MASRKPNRERTPHTCLERCGLCVPFVVIVRLCSAVPRGRLDRQERSPEVGKGRKKVAAILFAEMKAELKTNCPEIDMSRKK
ncbi:hypothetical protein NDU88_005435 [Pleurodeles waltl]|uniref:Uncharacterized protein n=1 Tax=Pleurodeles waltl TaxID=8319 RepID=A0AAV7RP85_PLEWA|nr:hypothetical protein NDU88_005435 [Pleurodeles waltl]